MSESYKFNRTTSETQVQVTLFNNLVLMVVGFLVFGERNVLTLKWLVGIGCLTVGSVLLK